MRFRGEQKKSIHSRICKTGKTIVGVRRRRDALFFSRLTDSFRVSLFWSGGIFCICQSGRMLNFRGAAGDRVFPSALPPDGRKRLRALEHARAEATEARVAALDGEIVEAEARAGEWKLDSIGAREREAPLRSRDPREVEVRPQEREDFQIRRPEARPAGG